MRDVRPEGPQRQALEILHALTAPTGLITVGLRIRYDLRPSSGEQLRPPRPSVQRRQICNYGVPGKPSARTAAPSRRRIVLTIARLGEGTAVAAFGVCELSDKTVFRRSS